MHLEDHEFTWRTEDLGLERTFQMEHVPSTFLGIWSINVVWQPKQWPGGPLLLAPSVSVAERTSPSLKLEQTQKGTTKMWKIHLSHSQQTLFFLFPKSASNQNKWTMRELLTELKKIIKKEAAEAADGLLRT